MFFDDRGVVWAGEPQAAIDHAEVGVFDGSVFERPGAKFCAFGGAAFREQLGAQGGIQPGFRGQVDGISQNKAFAVALTNYRQQDSGLADFFARGSGGVGQPD